MPLIFKNMKKLLILLLVCFSNSILAQEIDANKKYTHEVYFDTDKFVVPYTEENRLLLFIESLNDIPIDKVSIYGFTDDRGSDNYNQTLSQNRANAIKEVFSGFGIEEHLITNVNGKGEILLKVVSEDKIHKIRGLNRKVEIIVSPKAQEVVIVKEKEAVVLVEETKVKTTDDISKGLIKVGDKIILDKLYFKTGYSYITKESKPVLLEIANIMLKNDNIYFSIQGHVCCTKMSRDAIDKKTKKRNLSVARAKFIYNYLAKRGVDKRRMKYIGYRRKFPLGGLPEKDRRVEILVTYVGKNIVKRD